jgi:hypothetical protein
MAIEPVAASGVGIVAVEALEERDKMDASI